MIVSGGNEEKIKPAVNYIRHAIIGIVFLITVLFVFPVLMNLIGLPYGDYIKPSAIFDTIDKVSGTIFGMNVQPNTPSDTNSPSSTLPSSFDNL